MGKLLIRLGTWLQGLGNRLKCKWNGGVCKLMFKVNDCPQRLFCDCKNKRCS